MIAWQNAAALWALPLAAVPIVIHLLRTHQAKRVTFPSLRFVPASRAAAIRMRLPSDVLLMLLRVAVVALAVGALAGPILLTGARTAAWNGRIARAVIVDTSSSMRMPDGSGVAPESAAADAAAAEVRTATYARRIDASDLADGLARASRWLATSPPARREIVVISDLQRGAFGRPAATSITEGIGLRLVSIGRPAASVTFDGAGLFGAGRIAARRQAIDASADATAVTIEARPANEIAGLRVTAAPGAEPVVARLLRTVAIAGAPEPSADQPIAIELLGALAPGHAGLAPIGPGWMLRTVLRLRENPALSSPSAPSSSSNPDASGRDAATPDAWTIVARNGDGSPRIRAAASGNELILAVADTADSLLAAEVVQAALTARADVSGYAEHEVGRLDEMSQAALSRPPGPATADAWRTAEATDARWLWLFAIVLLGVEQWLRARSAPHREQEDTRAAA